MKTAENVRKFYESRKWKKVRKLVELRDSGRCQECGHWGTEVHHKIPLTSSNVTIQEIALGLDNLVLLCRKCHNQKRTNSQVREDIKFTPEGELIKR